MEKRMVKLLVVLMAVCVLVCAAGCFGMARKRTLTESAPAAEEKSPQEKAADTGLWMTR